MIINGEQKSYGKPMNVAEMLEAEGYKRTAVAVEVNLEIVPKTAYDTRVLQEDDAIEVVKFMGGG